MSPVAIVEKKKQRCCNTTIAAKKALSQKRLCELGSHLRFLLPSPLDYVGVLAHSVLNVSTEDLVLFRLSLNTQLLFAMRESFHNFTNEPRSLTIACIRSTVVSRPQCSSTCASICILKFSDSEATVVVLECWCDGDGDVFTLRSDCPPLRSQKGAHPTQMASNMPEWNQAHRAHQQAKDGGSIFQLTCALRRAHDFSNKIGSKTQSTKQSLPIKSAPPLVLILLKTTPSDETRISACSWAESASDQMRFSTRASTFILKISDSEAEVRQLLEDHPEFVSK